MTKKKLIEPEDRKPEDIAKELPRTLSPKRESAFKGMPAYLKEPKNYEKVYKAIYEAGNSKCSHSDIYEYSSCKKCEQSRINRVKTMKGLGFKDGQQYLAWLRVHQNMRTYHRDELEKYNGKKFL